MRDKPTATEFAVAEVEVGDSLRPKIGKDGMLAWKGQRGVPAPRTILTQLVVLVAATVVGALVAAATQPRNTGWAEVSPGEAAMGALFVMAPVIVILSVGHLRVIGLGITSLVVGGAIVVMFHLFWSNDSSTSALVFVWAWIAGIPIAVMIMAITNRRPSSRCRR